MEATTLPTATRSKRTVRPPARLAAFYETDHSNAEVDTGKRAKTSGKAGSSRKRKANSLSSYDLELSESEYEVEDVEESTDTGSDQDSTPAKGTKRHSSRRGGGGVRQPKQKTGLSAAAAPRGRVSVARPLTADARERLVEKTRAKQNQGTRASYATYWSVWQRYLNNGGYVKDAAPIGDLDISKPTPDVVGAFTNFLDWYAQGRPGDVGNGRKGGRKVIGTKLASMAGVHAAIQDGVKAACEKAGVAVWKLAEQPDYKLVYQLHCTKSVARSDSATSDVHLSMTADDLLKMAHELVGADDTDSVRDLALTLYQFSTVSRGDDVRPRVLDELMVRYLKSVGPSKCPSIAVMQPPGGGKTLGKRPGWKAFIRNRMPECCPVRALFAWLSCRFLLESEPMPMPGDDPLYLFPGRDAGQHISSSNHARIILEVFERIGIDPPKVTHEFRVFAAQALHDMGVSLEVIQRIGHWLLDSFGTAYIVPGFTPEALLALGFWPGAAQKDFTGYWAERFHVAVPEDLVYFLMPGLKELEAAAAELAAAPQRSAADRATRKSAQRMAQVLRMGAVVVVQDALELAERFPDNPIHKILLEQPSFQQLLSSYKSFKTLGGFEEQRPLSVQQRMRQLDQKLDLLFKGQVVRQHMPRNDWQYTNQQQQQVGEEEQQQDSIWDLSDLLQQLQGVAKGKLKAPEPLQQRVRQMAEQLQQDIAAHEDQLPYEDWEDAEQQPQQHEEQQHDENAGAMSEGQHEEAMEVDQQQDSGAAPRSDAQHAPGPAARSQHGAVAAAASPGPAAAAAAAAAAAPPQHRAAAAAGAVPGHARSSWGLSNAPAGTAAAAGASSSRCCAGEQAAAGADRQQPESTAAAQGTPQRQQFPAFGAGNLASSPGGLHVTPSGQQYTREQLQARHAGTTTPGGHYTAFFSMQHGGGAAQQQQQQQQYQQYEPLRGQQLQGAYSLQQQVQSVVEAAEENMAQMDQAQADIGNLTAELVEGGLTEVERAQVEQLLQQRSADLKALLLRRRQIDHERMRVSSLQVQQGVPHVGAGVSQGGVLGAGLLQRMGGSIDPINAIFHPYSAQQGISLSAYEPAMPSAGLPGGAVPAAAVVEVLQSLRQEVRDRPCCCAAHGQGCKTAASAQATHAGSSVANGSKRVADASAAGGAAGGGAAAAAAEGSASPPAKQQRKSSKSSSEPLAFPNFGKLSVVKAAKWYYETPLADHLTAKEGKKASESKGRTPAYLQEHGRVEWRGGQRGHRYQRWAEWLQLIKYLDDRQLQLSNNQGKVVGVMEAAAALDEERGERNLCQYYKEVVQPWAAAKAAAKEAAKQQQQQQQSEGTSEDEGVAAGETVDAE